MKATKIEALLTYLEFHLLKMVEDVEQHLSDPDVIGNIYDKAYAILNDFQTTLEMQSMLESDQPLTYNKKYR